MDIPKQHATVLYISLSLRHTHRFQAWIDGTKFYSGVRPFVPLRKWLRAFRLARARTE